MSEPASEEQGIQRKLSLHRCPYCHSGVEAEESVVCQGCLARHHSDCWDQHGVCASCSQPVSLAPREARTVASSRPHPLEEHPTPLAGSRIRVEGIPGGIRLSFPGVRNIPGNRLDGNAAIGGLVLGFLVAIFVGAITAAELSTVPAEEFRLGVTVLYVIAAGLLSASPFLALGAWGWLAWRREDRDPPRTLLDLTDGGIRIDRPHRWRKERQVLEAPRSELGNIKLDAGSLTADLGAQRITLAAGMPPFHPVLTGPETEWLNGVLTRWRNRSLGGPRSDPKAS